MTDAHGVAADTYCDELVDVLVVGGGVCGLWALHALRTAGYDAWLIENSALGTGQTIASQGILHAGAKYDRLPGNAIDASQAVADVQPVWARALKGGGGDIPDLSSVRVLDRRTILWTRRTVGSVAAGVGAKQVMRSEVKKLPRAHWPLGFETAPRGVRVYETPEAVIEPSSLVACMQELGRDRIRQSSVHSIEHRVVDDEARMMVALGGGFRVGCSALVLSAGEGNEALLDLAGEDGSVLMQRRPLHQLVALGAPFPLNGHCLKLDLDKPDLTVTTGELESKTTWYFGGGPAEEGVGRSREEQIAAGKAAVARCLPWVDQASFDWRVFEIDRAEGRTPNGKRPSEAVAVWSNGSTVATETSRVLAVWPTKLVLAPRAAGLVVERLRDAGVVPGGTSHGGAGTGAGLARLPEPGIAERVW